MLEVTKQLQPGLSQLYFHFWCTMPIFPPWISACYGWYTNSSRYPISILDRKSPEVNLAKQEISIILSSLRRSYHSLQLAGLQPPSLPQVGLPHNVQLADHRHALDDARLLGVLGLWLQAVQILPRVQGLQVGHLPEGGLQAGRGLHS